jgi:hypothetical protein
LSKKTSYNNIIAIKWGEWTHFQGRTGNRGEPTQICRVTLVTKFFKALLINEDETTRGEQE